MNTENKSEDTQVESGSTVGGDQPSLEALQAELEAARAEAAKFRKQKSDLAKERDELKSKIKPDAQEENYKQLWQEAQQALTKTQERAKSADIKSALSAKLPGVGVRADALEAALKLVDISVIEWSEDEGVDGTTVTAAIQKLKREHPFMFEASVATRGAKAPANGSGSEKTITRAEFDHLMKTNPAAWQAKRKEGYKVVGSV